MALSKPKTPKPSVGIDLGTTYSCVAVFQNGKPEVIANSQGNRITPSVVAFTKTGRLIGEGAEIQRKLDPPNAIYNSKRFIGRTFNDMAVVANRSMYPFSVVENDKKIQFQVENGPKSINLTPEEIAAAILSKLKKTAEDYLEETVEDVVITVPAYFTDSQRQATVNAGKIAGLNVTRIINEPTAAAMAYGLREGTKGDKGKRILVFDIGGGTFDVSVLEIEEDLIRVKATDGNSNLGGEDFNDLLVNHFKQEISRKHKIDISSNFKAIRRLTGACEKLKRNLSADNVKESKIELDNFLPGGKDFVSTLTRAKFENICQKRFDETIKCVDKVLQYAWLTKEEIDEIVLVGGSSRVPKLQAMLSSYFNNKVLNKSINPDEAVACGAAVQAAILNNDPHLAVKDLLLMDVLPLSIGLTLQGKLTEVILDRNTTIPVRKTKIVVTGYNNQTSAKFEITEGERALSKDNRILGDFQINGLPPKKAGEVKFEVLFEMDENGILSVLAAVQGSNQEEGITLDVRSAGKLSQEEVIRLVQEAEKMKVLDQKEENRVVAMNKLISLCNHVSFVGQDLSGKDIGDVLKSVEDTLDWINKHPDAKIGQFIGNYNVLKEKAANVLNLPAMQDLSVSVRVQHMSKLKYYMKEGRDLLLSSDGSDRVKAAECFFKAYRFAIDEGNLVKEIEALVHFGRSHKMLVATGCTEYLRMKHASKAIKVLSTVLALEQNKTLSEDDRDAVIQDLKFVVREALRVIENQKEKKMLNYFDVLMRALDYNWKRACENPTFCQILFECRIKEIKTYVKKIDTCLADENTKEAQNYLESLNYPKEQAKLVAKSQKEKQQMVELIELIQRKTSHAEGLKQIRLAIDLLEGAKIDDPVTIDKALMALDHLTQAKHLTQDKHDVSFIKANFLEGNIYMDYILNSSKAKSCFEKVVAVSKLKDFNGEEYRQAKWILDQIQEEQLKKGDAIQPVSREDVLAEVKPDIQKIKKADSSMGDATFLDFLLAEYPPKHKENFTKPEISSLESMKRAYIRLCVFYHPDKVDAAQFGLKHKILCGEISKFVNGRFLKM